MEACTRGLSSPPRPPCSAGGGGIVPLIWAANHDRLNQGSARFGQGLRHPPVRDAHLPDQDVDFAQSTDVHIVTGLLKLWFREMPEPILTHALYDAFIAAA